MSKFEFLFGWTSVAEMSYEDCLLSPVMIPVVVAKRSCDGAIIGWHEALTHAEISLCLKSVTLFNLDSVQEWALDKTNCRYEKVTEGFDVITAVPGDSLKAASKLAKRMLADMITRRPSGWVEESLRLINTYRELLPRKLVRKALAAIPSVTQEQEEWFTFTNEGEPNKLSCKLPPVKWKQGEKPETHEGNAKSKQKWLRTGREARRRANRNR